MNTKVVALVGLITAMAAGAKLGADKCQEVEDAMAELVDYPDLYQAVANEYANSFCVTAISNARNLCVEMPDDDEDPTTTFTCRQGKLYGPLKGGTEPCIDPGDTPMCLAHKGDIKSLNIDRAALVDALNKRKAKEEAEKDYSKDPPAPTDGIPANELGIGPGVTGPLQKP